MKNIFSLITDLILNEKEVDYINGSENLAPP